jgi:hypothetical protein
MADQEFSKESKEMMINVLWNIVSSEQLEFIADDEFSFNSMISLTARLNRTDLFMKLSTFESFKRMKKGPIQMLLKHVIENRNEEMVNRVIEHCENFCDISSSWLDKTRNAFGKKIHAWKCSRKGGSRIRLF